MGEPAHGYTVDRGRIRLADDVFVYLERTLASAEAASRPHGVAPTATAAGGVVAALGAGEAVWLGFQAVDPARPAIVRVRVKSPVPLDAVTGEPWKDGLANEPRNYLTCPPDFQIPGNPTFAVGTRATVLVRGTEPASLSFELVTLEQFTNLTGIPAEPLDPEKAYKGWRLP